MDENKNKVTFPVEAAQPAREGEPMPESSDNPATGGADQKIHWATKRERVIAWILAIIVILITLAYAYSIATGDLFRH